MSFPWSVRARTKSRPRPVSCRPRLEALEGRWLPSAVLPGFDANSLGATDDGSSAAVSIGFTADFFGRFFSQVFINNNGNLTVGAASSFWSPINFATTRKCIIAPYFGDVDTTVGNVVHYGAGAVDGHNAFGVTWPGVGFYNAHTDRLNTFQALLIDRSDTGAGNFDIEFNYDSLQWEAGDASGGVDGLGGNPARAGFSVGTGVAGTYFTMPNAGVVGAYLDSNPVSGLIYNSIGSAVPGRYVFALRDGSISDNQPPTADAGGPYALAEGGSLALHAQASDPDGDALTYSWSINGHVGAASGANPTLTWAQLQALGVDDGPATFAVTVQVDDGHGHIVTSAAGSIALADTAPTAALIAPASADEGAAVAVSLADAFDPSAADTAAGLRFAFALDSAALPNAYADASSASSATLTFPDGPADIVVYARVFDKDGGSSDYSATVHVNNLAPVITSITTTGGSAGAPVSVSAAFADAGVLDTHTAVIDWGDGTASAGVVSESAGAGTVSGTHSYASGGTFTVRVTVIDKDGASASAGTGAAVTGVGLRNGVLWVVGTAGDDWVVINGQGRDRVMVHASFLPGDHWVSFSTAGLNEIDVALGGGADRLTVAGNVRVPVVVHDGAGAARPAGPTPHDFDAIFLRLLLEWDSANKQ